MRTTRLFVLLALAACGGSHATTPDAATPAPDSPSQPDAMADAMADAAPDAAPDAPPDAGATSTTRVWVLGDFMTNNSVIAGSFLDGATLPFGPMAGTPIVVPGGTATLPDISNFTLDVTADASKIVFIADLATAGVYDLYIANADGSSPTMLVAGQSGVDITSVALSPDGTKVAYTADSIAIDTGYDLWVVNTTGTPAPVKVSPDRPMTSPSPSAQDVNTAVTWSADSKYLAFSGDLTMDKYEQAYVVDTTAAAPAAVELLAQTDIAMQASGGQGVSGLLQFDAADDVYFRARVTAGSAQYQLFVAKPDGSMRTDITSIMPARSDMSTPDIGAFAIAPDGMTLVIASDTPTATAYDLYATPLVMPMPVKLTSAPASTNPAFTAPLWFSPDAKSVAYVATYGSASNEPYVSKLDGSDTHRLVNVTAVCPTSCDAIGLSWTPDGSALYLTGDITTNNDTKLYRVDPTMTDQTPTLAVDVPTSGDIIGSIIRKTN
jgi:hypothetical protein